MKTRYFLVVLALLLSTNTFAQTGRNVSGVVKDSTGITLPGSTVKLLTGKDSMLTATDANGRYSFSSVSVNQFSLVVGAIGYKPLKRRFILDNDNKPAVLAPIILKSESITLNQVNIVDVNPMKLKEDTVEYNAAAFKVRQGAAVEDMIKKAPGLEVDKDGNITAQGKSISKVRLNGKDYMAGDVTSLTRNLPADLVQNFQVIDDYGDQANITGIKTGDPQKILNINISPSKNYGYFAQLNAGAGRDAIPQVDGTKDGNRYLGSGNVFSFSGDRQVSVMGNLNNTNTNLFNFGGGGGGGRGGGGGFGGGGGGSGANANGITTARSIGFNYRDSWGKKISAYGSYSFADNTVNTISSTLQNNISNFNPSNQTQNSTQKDDRINHRFNFNIEYKPDTINYLKVVPTFSYSSLKSNQNTRNTLTYNSSDQSDRNSDYILNSLSNSTTPNYGLGILYNHRFKQRRNFSVQLNGGSSTSNQYQNPVYDYLAGKANAPVNQMINTDTRTDSVGATFSYIQPVGRLSYLEVNYAYHNAYTTINKETDTLTADGISNRYNLLSNNYNFSFITNRFGLNYRFIDKKYNYTLGISAQPSLLEGQSVVSGATHVNTFNISPVARFIYNFSRSQSLSVNYSGSSSTPAYTELQPVIDFSNATYPVQGNPNLKPAYNNVLSFRYNKFDFATGNVFFSNFNFTQTNDKVVANTITYPGNYRPNPKLAGTILTQYLNASGFYSASAFYLYSKPWAKRKFTLSYNGNLSFNNNISFISSADSVDESKVFTQKNIAKNLVLTQGLRFRTDITDIIDAEVSASYSLNHSANSIPTANVNNNYRTINLGLNGKNYVWKNWTISYDYTKTIYEGYKGATNPNILNTYVERRFLKNNVATIRFSAMDMFNQNTGYSSSQTGNYISESNVNRLGRYYLLTFTLRLQKFAGKAPMRGPGGPGGPGGDRPGGGGSGGFGGGPGGGGPGGF